MKHILRESKRNIFDLLNNIKTIGTNMVIKPAILPISAMTSCSEGYCNVPEFAKVDHPEIFDYGYKNTIIPINKKYRGSAKDGVIETYVPVGGATSPQNPATSGMAYILMNNWENDSTFYPEVKDSINQIIQYVPSEMEDYVNKNKHKKIKLDDFYEEIEKYRKNAGGTINYLNLFE